MHIILVAKTTKKLSFVPRIAKELKKEKESLEKIQKKIMMYTIKGTASIIGSSSLGTYLGLNTNTGKVI